ncbi:murein hydrolase activator EnvC family protein [Undibacterium pigrum]|uniref:Septal ring factor EnvC (AmiA/AmiB activator) n=1 Tax=Undibacterium pigrum TaxID=401470 RepID=A0A318JDQ5_9BURK|nr:peptidoglycan DD-metalloendopeptidase family protein [Undibacterium pigrum]PXX41869.1 septal ring factor EnvC (AmiA/AmiB activator) [Undibacterium pigrum]
MPFNKTKSSGFFIAALLSLSLAGTATPAMAASNARAQQKTKAEADRAELQNRLKALKTDINKTETAKDNASDALAESEKSISEANRSLRDLQAEQAQTEAKVKQLTEQQQALADKVEKQKTQLSNFLRRQYMRGDSDRIKLLLSGDNPNRINRELQYMGYVSQTQAKLIDGLRVSLQAVEKNAEDAKEAKAELDEIADEEKSHKLALEKEKKRHATLVSQLAEKLYVQKKQADSLEKDEQRLANLVSQLNKLIEEQAKADAARAALEEKQRQERIAAAQKERAKQAAQGKKPAKITNPNAIDDDEPPKQARATTPPAGEFDKLKGQLRLPVKGEILARFGSKRTDGPSWKGMFIKANEGAEIKTIAPGKIIFADWWKGYGNMVIVDHGGSYWSLYGNNQAVLKHVGDVVKTGDVIASAGNSGGNEESGLYFEVRHQGRVFDPLNWIVK